MAELQAVIRVTEIPPKDRIGTIYTTFDNLRTGERMEIINDHDPRHLYDMLMNDKGGQFDWTYVADGPDEWRVVIAKL